jgi:hypothetical protein
MLVMLNIRMDACPLDNPSAFLVKVAPVFNLPQPLDGESNDPYSQPSIELILSSFR